MLARLKNILTIDVSSAKQQKPKTIGGELIVKAKRFDVRNVDAQRLEIAPHHDCFFPRQKFVFQLMVDGLRLQQGLVGVGLVEKIDGERLFAVYRLEGDASRQLLNSFLEQSDMKRATRALNRR